MQHIKKKIMASVVGVLIAQGAMANGGTLDFTGVVTDATCNVSVNGGGADATITLPRVSTNALSNVGDTAGRVFVRMALSGCAPATSGPATVHAYWEASPEINGGGRLRNKAIGGAANVEIQMQNASLGIIDLAEVDGSQNTTSLAWTGALAGGELLHFAQYYAAGQSTAGPVEAQLEYVLVYQ